VIKAQTTKSKEGERPRNKEIPDYHIRAIKRGGKWFYTSFEEMVQIYYRGIEHARYIAIPQQGNTVTHEFNCEGARVALLGKVTRP
jgi:hypothetical protein